ncbi:MAG: ATP-binding protein [Candidatus Colwellbacteria bacterium]|nr:ATP-binding protein [Candidatus Colwellbacteria bacterium]
MRDADIGSTENLVAVKEIRNNTVFLKNGGMRRVIMATGINMDLKSEEDQQAVISSFQNLLNSLDFPIQFSIHSRKMAIKEYLSQMAAKKELEKNDLIRMQFEEYIAFIEDFVSQNSIVEKSFFITVPFDPINLSPIGKKSDNTNDQSVEDLLQYTDKMNFRADQILNGLRQIGLRAIVLNEGELKELYRNFYNPKTTEKEPMPEESPIAPGRVEIDPDHLKINEKFVKSMFVLNYPRYLASSWLMPIINLPELIDISIHVSPIDTGIALKNLMRKSAHIGAEISEREEKGLVRDPALETALMDTENLRDTLQQTREKLFSLSLYMSIYADTLDELKKIEFRISSMFERALVTVKSPLFEQAKCFSSVIPICSNEFDVSSAMNTSPASAFFPFISPDLTSDEGIMYGVNLHNNTLVIFDRFSLENHNSVIFAKSGSGKSYAAKLELLRSVMMGTDVVIIDPENEYKSLADALGGTTFKISLTSKDSINPFDIPVVPEDEEDAEVLQSHIANLTGLIKLMIGVITPAEEGVLDRAINETYGSRDIAPGKDFKDAEPPLLEDLEIILRNMDGGKDMADRLYRFTKGSYSGFTNRATNIDLKNRVIVFSVRDLEEELRPIAMYIILNFVWNIVRSKLKRRILVVDEAWLMMKYPDSASFLFNLVRRARKYYLGITTITQDVEDFLNSPYGRPVITNSSLQLLLKQSPATIDTVGKAFNLTEIEKNYLVEATVGQGLVLLGQKHVAMQIVSSGFEHEIITTNPEEIIAKRNIAEEKTEI